MTGFTKLGTGLITGSVEAEIVRRWQSFSAHAPGCEGCGSHLRLAAIQGMALPPTPEGHSQRHDVPYVERSKRRDWFAQLHRQACPIGKEMLEAWWAACQEKTDTALYPKQINSNGLTA